MNRLKDIDQETIKALNQKRIVHLLYRKKQMTRQDIAKELKLSIPTIISNVNELISEGYIDEAGVAVSTGGRKPSIIKFVPNSRYSFGVCLTRDYVRTILTDMNFNIIAERINDMPEELISFEKIMQCVVKDVYTILQETHVQEDKVLGIGFSLPGTVNEKSLYLENAPNLSLRGVDFKEYQSNFRFPIYVENEANASANAEAFINFDGTVNSIVFISVTEGIGTGIIIGDNLYKGYNKRAGEFGHMTIVKDGMECNCGKRGCWELYASNKALLRSYRKAFSVKDRDISGLFKKAENDNRALGIIDEYLDYFAEGIRNIILILDPKNIIIDGEISMYRESIERRLKDKVFIKNSFFDEKECNLSFSNLKGNASIFGAALLPMEKLFFLADKVI